MKDLASHLSGKLIWAEAPGSCMVFGEHAVLKGYPAVVCALNPRLRVYAKKREDGWLHVEAMGTSRSISWEERASLATDFSFLHACIDSFPQASCGLEVRVESSLSSVKGFGSSAALIAASLLAISLVFESSTSLEEANASDRQKEEIFLKGLAILRKVQGSGSGADLAASIYGGCLEYSYSHKPRALEPLGLFETIYLVYSGHKTATSLVLKQLHEKQQAGVLDVGAIEELGQTSLSAIALWPSLNDKQVLGHLCHRHQEAMKRLELVDEGLDRVCSALESQKIAHKISGSGLGDSVLCFEKPEIDESSVTKVEVDFRGLRYGYKSIF